MRIPGASSVTLVSLREEWRSYSLSFFRSDLLAALAVALSTIPQSIAYSLIAGLPPTAGLFSAIFGTIFTAAFGSSKHLVSGPSTGVAILIQSSISDVLATYFDNVAGVDREALSLHILTQIVLIMGLIQIAAAFFNVRKVLQFVSRPVILGYFVGITVAIVVTQLFYFFGIVVDTGDQPVWMKVVSFCIGLPLWNWKATLIGSCGIVLFFILRRWSRFVPDALVMLAATAVLAFGLNEWIGGAQIITLGNTGLSSTPIPQVTLPYIDFRIINKVFSAAVAIGFLAILEVSSISRAFAARSGQQVSVNQDVFGLGVGNCVLSSLVGSLPCSGSITRTTLNYRVHAKTRFAAIMSGILIAVIILFFWPLVQRIPLAALAALLIATVPTLINWREIHFCLRATREDAWVFIITFVSCLIFSLDMAFFIGIVISIATYLKKSSEPLLVEYAFNTKGRLMIVSPKEDVHRKVRIIGIGGELYFAAADVFQSALRFIAEDPNVQAIVLRLNNVHHMDASMCLAILQLHDLLKSTDRHLLISGLTEAVWHVFHRTGLVKQIGMDNLYFTDESNPQFSTWKACLRAQELIHKGKSESFSHQATEK